MRITPPILVVLLALAAPLLAADHPSIHAMRVPQGGIQPQIAVDAHGVVHLVYLKGPERGCDVFYTRSADGGVQWAPPVRVNSVDNSAVAVGNIRGPRLAIGAGGRVHVAWNGAHEKETPSMLWYARLDGTGRAFEPQRGLITITTHLDGGSAIAADGKGGVHVVFHAAPRDGGTVGEAGRRVYVATSLNEGETFAAEQPVGDAAGVCACCSLAAFIDDRQKLMVLYRAVADGGAARDMRLLIGDRAGEGFTSTAVHPWRVTRCPMSTGAIATMPAGEPLVAWESDGQVHLAKVDMSYRRMGEPVAPPGRTGGRRFPVIATNSRGYTLLAWTEGVGWQRGGDAAWQLFGPDGAAIAEGAGSMPGVEVWGTIAAFTRGDRSFVILY